MEIYSLRHTGRKYDGRPPREHSAFKSALSSNAGVYRLHQAGGVLLPPRAWHAQNGRVHVSQVQLHATGDGDLRGFSEEDTTEELKRKFEIEGQTEFILAAIRNSDLRFETFKADPDIKTVWTSKNPMGVTPAPAVKFESDCSLMNPSRGFDWLK